MLEVTAQNHIFDSQTRYVAVSLVTDTQTHGTTTVTLAHALRVAMYEVLEIDNSCDFDGGHGDEPLIQELDLYDVSQVPPELMEQEYPTSPESASPTELAPTVQEETAETVFDVGSNNFSE